MSQQSNTADIFEKYLNFKASLGLDRLVADEAAFSAALENVQKEWERIVREELPAALEEDLRNGDMDYAEYKRYCAQFGIEAKEPPATQAVPPSQEMSWEEKAMIAILNKWWSEGGSERRRLEKLLSNIGLEAQWYTMLNIAVTLSQIIKIYKFKPSEGGGWLWYQKPGNNEALAIPADRVNLEAGEAMAPVREMFRGFEEIPDAGHLRFKKVYQACHLKQVENGYKPFSRGYLTLEGVESEQPIPQEPESYDALLEGVKKEFQLRMTELKNVFIELGYSEDSVQCKRALSFLSEGLSFSDKSTIAAAASSLMFWASDKEKAGEPLSADAERAITQFLDAIGMEQINPKPGDAYNARLHSIHKEEVGNIERGRILRVNTRGLAYKSERGDAFRKARVVLSSGRPDSGRAEPQQAGVIPQKPRDVAAAIEYSEKNKREFLQKLDAVLNETKQSLSAELPIKNSYDQLLHSLNLVSSIPPCYSITEEAMTHLTDLRKRVGDMSAIDYFFKFKNLQDEFDGWSKKAKEVIRWDSDLILLAQSLRSDYEEGISRPFSEEQITKLRSYMELRGFEIIWPKRGDELSIKEHHIVKDDIDEAIGRGRVIRAVYPGMKKEGKIHTKAGIFLSR